MGIEREDVINSNRGLKIPCITIRENTERPITVEVGSNVVAGTDSQKIIDNAMIALQGRWKSCAIPELWDGLASERIADISLNLL